MSGKALHAHTGGSVATRGPTECCSSIPLFTVHQGPWPRWSLHTPNAHSLGPFARSHPFRSAWNTPHVSTQLHTLPLGHCIEVYAGAMTVYGARWALETRGKHDCLTPMLYTRNEYKRVSKVNCT